MITVINGNVFDSDAKLIGHQVNCQGVMGSGVASEVKSRFPGVYKEYNLFCDKCKIHNHDMLGEVLFVDAHGGVMNFGEVNENTCTFPVIANIFGQDTFGYEGVYTKYSALESGLKVLHNVARYYGWKVAMPYLIGCDRGGADWNTVYLMIEMIFGTDVDVELWKLNK